MLVSAAVECRNTKQKRNAHAKSRRRFPLSLPCVIESSTFQKQEIIRQTLYYISLKNLFRDYGKYKKDIILFKIIKASAKSIEFLIVFTNQYLKKLIIKFDIFVK